MVKRVKRRSNDGELVDSVLLLIGVTGEEAILERHRIYITKRIFEGIMSGVKHRKVDFNGVKEHLVNRKNFNSRLTILHSSGLEHEVVVNFHLTLVLMVGSRFQRLKR